MSLLSQLKERNQEPRDSVLEGKKLNSKDEKNTIAVFSKVLGRDIVISWKGKNPKVVYVDQTPYTLKEIQELKSRQLSVKDLKNVHNIKAEFDGHVVEKTQ